MSGAEVASVLVASALVTMRIDLGGKTRIYILSSSFL